MLEEIARLKQEEEEQAHIKKLMFEALEQYKQDNSRHTEMSEDELMV